MLIKNNIKNLEKIFEKNLNFDKKKLLKNNLFLLKHFTEIEYENTKESDSNKEEIFKESFFNFISNIINEQTEILEILNYEQIKYIINDFNPMRAGKLIEKSKKLNDNQIINLIENYKAKKSILSLDFFTKYENMNVLEKLEHILDTSEKFKKFKNYDYFYEKSDKKITIQFLLDNPYIKTEHIIDAIEKNYLDVNNIADIRKNLCKKIKDLDNFVDYFYKNFDSQDIDLILQNNSINEKIIKKLLVNYHVNLKFLKAKLSEEFVLEYFNFLNLEDIIGFNSFNVEFHIKLLNNMNDKEKIDYFNNVLIRKTNLKFNEYEEIIKKFNFKLDFYSMKKMILEDTSERFLIKNLNQIENNIKKYELENNIEKCNNEKIYKLNLFSEFLSSNNNRDKIIEKNINYIMENDVLLKNLVNYQLLPKKILIKIINNEERFTKIKDIFIQNQNIFDKEIFNKIKTFKYKEDINIMILNNKYFWINKNNIEIKRPFENNINIYGITPQTLLFISKIYTNNEIFDLNKTKKFILENDIRLN